MDNTNQIVPTKGDPVDLLTVPTLLRPKDPVYCPTLLGGSIGHLVVAGHGYNQYLVLNGIPIYNNGSLTRDGVSQVWFADAYNAYLLAELYKDITFATPRVCGEPLLRRLLVDATNGILCRVATTYASYLAFIHDTRDGKFVDTYGNYYSYAIPINGDGSVRYGD